MDRRETIEVWNPDPDDDVFTVDTNGTSFEQLTDEDGEYVGRRLTGDSVSFDFHFPTADVASEDLLEELLEIESFEYGSAIMDGQTVVYDLEHDSAFNIGCETETQIVVHTKANTTRPTIQKLYTELTSLLDVPVRVVNTQTFHERV